MAHSLTSVPHVKKIRQDLKNGATVVCHKNSVFEVKADVLVISRSGSIESMVRQKVGGSEWDRKKKKAEPFYVFDWKILNISTFDSKGDFHYSKVYVVEVPFFYSYNSKKWFEEYQKMIKNLLTEAAKDHKTSITIPLLGTNAGGAPKDECIGRVMDVIFTFTKFTSLQKINIVVQDWPEFTLVQDLFEKHEKPKTSDSSTKSDELQLFSSDNEGTPPNKEEEFKIRRHQSKSSSHNVKDRATEKMGSSGIPAIREVSLRICSYCSRYTINIVEYSCHHVFCIACAPTDESCPQCKVDKGNERLSNRAEENAEFDRARLREHGNYSGHRMRGDTKDKVAKLPNNVWQIDSHGNMKQIDLNHTKSDKGSYADKVRSNPKVDSDHNNYSNGNSSKSYNEDEGYSKGVSLLKCSYCARYTNSIIKLSCHHEFCIHCAPTDESCPQCKVDTGLFNKAEENGADQGNRVHRSSEQTHKEDVTYSLNQYHCKSCLGNTFIKPRELPCHHFCCFICFDEQKTCQQCKVDAVLSNRAEENGADQGNRVLSPSEQTHEENVTHSSKKHHCKSCLGNTYNELKELPCRHFCCFICFDYQKTCQQCRAVNLNRDDTSNTDQSSRKGTHREGRDISMVEECNRCKLDLTNIRSPCGHILCAKCLPKGCNDRSCCRESDGNRGQSSWEQTFKDDPVYRDKSSREQTLKDDPVYRGQSSRERTQGEGRDITVVEECNRCKLDLTNISSIRSACGHILCAKCLPKGCNDRSCQYIP